MTQKERERAADQLLETWRNGNRNDMRRALERLTVADAVSVAALMIYETRNTAERLDLIESLQCLKG